MWLKRALKVKRVWNEKRVDGSGCWLAVAAGRRRQIVGVTCDSLAAENRQVAVLSVLRKLTAPKAGQRCSPFRSVT